MNTKQILRYAFFGALVYGAYKLGEKNAKDDVESEDKLAKGSPEPVEQTEADYIREIIDCIRMKPKTQVRLNTSRIYFSKRISKLSKTWWWSGC